MPSTYYQTQWRSSVLDILVLSKCCGLIGGVNGCMLMALNQNYNAYEHVDSLNACIN